MQLYCADNRAYLSHCLSVTVGCKGTLSLQNEGKENLSKELSNLAKDTSAGGKQDILKFTALLNYVSKKIAPQDTS